MQIKGIAIDDFTAQYLVAALWSSYDDSDEAGGKPMDHDYSLHDFAPEALARAVADCEAFRATVGALIDDREKDAAHDFWFTRCGHGTGFWDGDWIEGDTLTAACKAFGNLDPYVGDDGQIYFA